mmetsp:Transcript_11349/g.18777  ORF Transcript_11349/g.18777 Transcript_11349/m.18777 type:complete len:180 (-) Transcript_11349:68-607(-)
MKLPIEIVFFLPLAAHYAMAADEQTTTQTTCNLLAYPTPAYHALGESDAHLFDAILASTFKSVSNLVASDDAEVNFQLEDQMIWPAGVEEDRRSLAKLSAKLPWKTYRWLGASNYSCRSCHGDTTDRSRSLSEEIRLDGFADAMVSSLMESGIEFFSEVECVTFSCDGTDIEELSVGCL